MGSGFLIDTNIAIYFLDAKLLENARNYVQSALDSGTTYLSVISKMELLGWNFASPEDEQKARQFTDDLLLLHLTDEIVEKTIDLRKQSPKIKLPDAIIAASALVHNLTLISRNSPDFSRISGLDFVNPFDL
jgi:predicted nucleic acid-binding protein